ncbi:NADPH-dependent FMN reductase [Streptomyces sp. 3MP-14]|uniref:NADPH-dependent FMN reductase n=1 Tax=Streptomyces mimosae TaxID=2586635 RepID=A0A5N6A769_9ACTN|nr:MULTISPECIES: NAD(P)H-dependent oxidoreductase [Streptomyces]KAB8163776.1 NADPH-dependent FMN reductase [Streptomyces mimosae]KAB8175219.1 NADPH-dependent FMN reductase [Streptomyces sp. 3MP-14]
MAPSPAQIRVGIIVGTTRPGRKAATVAEWALGIATTREGATFEIVDIADQDLPFLDEPLPAMTGQYTKPHTRRWAERIAPFDAFLFVTPEYNGNFPGVLKNAIDFLYAEWRGKTAGVISYGIQGGARSAASLTTLLSQFEMTVVPSGTRLVLSEDFKEMKEFAPGPSREKEVLATVDEVLAQARLRETGNAPGEPAADA